MCVSAANLSAWPGGAVERPFVRAVSLLHSHFCNTETLQEAIIRSVGQSHGVGGGSGPLGGPCSGGGGAGIRQRAGFIAASLQVLLTDGAGVFRAAVAVNRAGEGGASPSSSSSVCFSSSHRRSAGAAVYGTRSLAHETFFQQHSGSLRNSGIPNHQDSAFSLPSKARHRLLKHGVNLL